MQLAGCKTSRERRAVVHNRDFCPESLFLSFSNWDVGSTFLLLFCIMIKVKQLTVVLLSKVTAAVGIQLVSSPVPRHWQLGVPRGADKSITMVLAIMDIDLSVPTGTKPNAIR